MTPKQSSIMSSSSVDVNCELPNQKQPPLLPGELKRLQRLKKRSNVNTISSQCNVDENVSPVSVQIDGVEGSSCFSTGSTKKMRLGALRPLSLNQQDKEISKEKTLVEDIAISWSLATRLTINFKPDSSIASDTVRTVLNSHLSSSVSSSASVASSTADNEVDLKSKLCYYRFPFPQMSANAHAKMARMLMYSKTDGSDNADDLALQHFSQIVGSWKRSFLSLYGNWRAGLMDHFYYLQHGLVLLFLRNFQSSRVYISEASPAMLKALDTDGISYARVVQDGLSVISAEDDEEEEEDQDDDEEKEDSDEGQENLKQRQWTARDKDRRLRRRIDARVSQFQSRRAVHQGGRSSSSVVVIEGEGNVHALVDYVVNQKDGRSFLILPELISPGPFLFGTLCSLSARVTGPLADTGELQLQIDDGLILPVVFQAALQSVRSVSHSQLSLLRSSADVDMRTSSYSSIKYQ